MTVVAIVAVAHATDEEFALTEVRGEALLTHTVRGLLGTPDVDLVAVAAPQRCAEVFSSALSGLSTLVVPGTLRQAFAAVEPRLSPDSIILVHDVLRSFGPADTVRDVLAAVRAGAPVAVPVLPMSDTVKVTEEGLITGTEDRTHLRTAQTPIGYTLAAFRAAADPIHPDPGATLVPGHPDGMRVTSAFELTLAEAIAAAGAEESL